MSAPQDPQTRPMGGGGSPSPRVARTRTTLLSLVDQAAVSATNFGTSALVGRLCGASELGMYSLGFSVLLLCIALQESLVAAPYTVFGSRLRGERLRHLRGSALVHSLLLAVAAGAALALGALKAWSGPEPALPGVLMAMAVALPWAVLRSYTRGVCFSRLRFGSAVGIDALVGAVQLGALLALAGMGALSAATTYLATGVACALGSLAWLWRSRGRWKIHLSSSFSDGLRSWELGRWVAAEQLTLVAKDYIGFWLLSFWLDPAATGLLAASRTVVWLANPLILGFANLLGPLAADAHARGGADALRAVIRRGTLQLAVAVGGISLAAAAGGAWLVGLVYGPAYADQGPVITALAATIWLSALPVGAAHALVVLERAQLTWLCQLLALASTLSALTWLVPTHGVLGAALGQLVGAGVATLGIALTYRYQSRTSSARPSLSPAS